MTTNKERSALARFEERTRELELHPDRSDLLVLFAGWQGLQTQLARIRHYLAARREEAQDRKTDDGHR